jgi:HPt (histidine-containing phosphotransfer) domain-containing protein
MKSTEYWRRASPASSAPKDPFEELRDAFYARLRSDRVRLTTLAALLARAEGDPASIFQDIQLFAHRLRGGAAIFEAPEIGVAANVLEQAAAAASVAHADNSDASVWTALESLVDRLAIVNGKRVPLAPAMKDRSHSDSKAKTF